MGLGYSDRHDYFTSKLALSQIKQILVITNICVTVAALGCLIIPAVTVVHRHHGWVGLLFPFLPWPHALTPSVTLKASHRGGSSIQVQMDFSESHIQRLRDFQHSRRGNEQIALLL